LEETRTRPPLDQDLDEWLADRTPTSQSHADGRQEYLKEKDKEKPST
jgi:hypothetical protein